jgi:hypothetical protein
LPAPETLRIVCALSAALVWLVRRKRSRPKLPLATV